MITSTSSSANYIKIYSLFFLLLLLFSCSSDKNPELVGRWKLVAVLVDPGDGSGTFQSTSENKFLQFNPDNTLESNSSHCLFTQESGEGKEGSYSADALEIYFNCNGESTRYSFQLVNNELILNFPLCIEPCQEKYQKVQ